MEIWNFYHSGILYGKLYLKDGTVWHEFQNPETGLSEAPAPMDDFRFYQILCSRNPKDILMQLSELNRHVLEDEASFTTAAGAFFTRRADGSYIERRRKFGWDLLSDKDGIYAVLLPGRDYLAVLVKEGREAETPLAAWDRIFPAEQPLWPVRFHGTFSVTTEDGEKLATDVYLPAGIKEKVPTVLIRTPYGKSNGKEIYYRFVQRGYAVVIQDTRGREDSTGEWLPDYYEIEDGRDTLSWIAAQPWSDQKVAMTGGSYLGYVQWAAAASGSPYLKAMLSSVCAGSAFFDVPRRGGCFTSGMLAWAFAMSEQRMRADLMVRDDWDEVLNYRPIRDIPVKALGHEIPFLSKWMDHPELDDLWKRSSWKDRFLQSETKIEVPALIMSGWFDDNGMGTTEALELVADYAPENYKVILGPWMHSGNANYDLHGIYLGERALRYDMDQLCFQWIEHFLKNVDNGIEQTPTVEYYTVGQGAWKTAEAWPVPGTEETVLYLNGECDHAAVTNDGILSAHMPKQAHTDGYLYDPAHPSTHIVDMSENELEVPEDYTQEEQRPDVLCYSTAPLTQPLTVTGDIRVTLYLSSDCPDTDLMVRITDVDENGTSIKLADGVLSAKYRNSFEHPEFMEPGKVYPIEIRTTKISNTFMPGHRLRLTVTSSGKNFIFPNSNTERGFDSLETRIAHNVIHHGGEYPSQIRLRIEK